jgi:hypothetical protein
MEDAVTCGVRREIPVSGVVLLLGLTVWGCGGSPGKGQAPASNGLAAGPAQARPARKASGGKVRTEMKGVNLWIDPSVVLQVRSLRGALVSTHEGDPPWFDDQSSFLVEIDEGEIAVTPASLSALMNRYVFAYPDAPVKDVEIEIAGNHLRQTSTLKKKIPVRATIEGDLSVTPDGKLRLHPTSIKAGKLPVKGLLDLFDVELSEMLKTDKSRGVSVVENDLLLDPERLLPPPRIRGKVTGVRLENDHIVQIFGQGKGSSLKPSIPDAAHYMYYKGGELSFGKLTMHGADLQIIDKDPKDPFQFYFAQYKKQLVAGTSHTLNDGGLVVYMPDAGQTK